MTRPPKYVFLGIGFFLLGFLIMLSNCKKDSNSAVGTLTFSSDYNQHYFYKDTLSFDTAFATLGTATRFFKVHNTLNHRIKIEEIKLAGLQGNQFRINVDGVSGRSFKNVTIEAKDSIYIFAEATIDPNLANNPFLIYDEVQFVSENATQKVVLEAWGQNAYYHKHETISTAVNWLNDKPHIVLRAENSLVGLHIDSTGKLTIPASTKIFMGPNAIISVDGKLLCNGAVNGDSIVFQGLRLEDSYKNKPGQWLGILYSRTAEIWMKSTIVDESFFGVSDEEVYNILAGVHNTTSNLNEYNLKVPTVNLDKTIIRNASSNAMVALFTNLTATNCLFHAVGGQMLLLAYGGTYNLTHCTLANDQTDHKNEMLNLWDAYYDNIGNVLYTAPVTANIINTVVYGRLTNEISFVSKHNSLISNFQNCALQINTDTFANYRTSDNACVFNQKLKFRNTYMPDSTSSPLYHAGKTGLPITDDLFGHTRSATPDIGAVEWGI